MTDTVAVSSPSERNVPGETVFTVTAPRAGIIVEHKVSVGQQVAPEAGSLLAIADLSHVWVYANLSDDAHLDIGAPARVTLETGGTVDGVVDQVSAIVDPERHTVPVRVALDNASGALRPGAYADVRFFQTNLLPRQAGQNPHLINSIIKDRQSRGVAPPERRQAAPPRRARGAPRRRIDRDPRRPRARRGGRRHRWRRARQPALTRRLEVPR